MSKVQVDLNKSLVCIEYPGIVQNVDKMLDTLGGIRQLSMVFILKKKSLLKVTQRLFEMFYCRRIVPKIGDWN